MQPQMKQTSTRTNMRSRRTGRKRQFFIGGVIALLLAITPFIFYLYKFAPDDSKVWETAIFTFESKGFSNVQNFIHALFTKITFIVITTLWFITSKDWWKWAILIPLTMFLFQFLGVINYQISYIDDFDFWYALIIIAPILMFIIWIGYELNKTIGDIDLREEIEEELESYR